MANIVVLSNGKAITLSFTETAFSAKHSGQALFLFDKR
jgi:hypothetical protein